jgi:archaellum component FlaC
MQSCTDAIVCLTAYKNVTKIKNGGEFMPVKEAIIAALKELVLPELVDIKKDVVELKSGLAANNKRLDDMNAHLVDQSRRIDTLSGRIDTANDHTDAIREAVDRRLENINKRMDQLYEVVVRREEHYLLTNRVQNLERELAELKKRVAA